MCFTAAMFNTLKIIDITKNNENRGILKHNWKVRFVCWSYEKVDDELNINYAMFFIIIYVFIIFCVCIFKEKRDDSPPCP